MRKRFVKLLLFKVDRLYDFADAKTPDSIIQTVQRVDAADADKERILRKETGYITLQRTFRQKRTLALGVPCHMHPRIAAGTGWQISAGKPAVFAIGLLRIVQTDLQPLNQPILVPNRNQETVGAGERPVAIIGAKARNTVQVMAVTAQEVGQKPTPALCFRHTAVLVSSDALFAQAPF